MSKKEIKYAKAVEELNDILAGLDSEKIDVDELVAKTKRAIELIKLCREKIEATEVEVKKIVKDFSETGKE